MKNVLSILLFLNFLTLLNGQTNRLFYKSVFKQADGTPIKNMDLNVLIKISNYNGLEKYSECHLIRTDQNGYGYLWLGYGNDKSGKLENINFESEKHILKILLKDFQVYRWSDIYCTPFSKYPNLPETLNPSNIINESNIFYWGGIKLKALGIGYNNEVLSIEHDDNIDDKAYNDEIKAGKSFIEKLSDEEVIIKSSTILKNYLQKGFVFDLLPEPNLLYSKSISIPNSDINTFQSKIGNLEFNKIYYIRSYITYENDTIYGETAKFQLDKKINVQLPCPNVPKIFDIDGNSYNTVQIGNQCWTKENLKVTKFRDGSLIQIDESGGVTGSITGQTWTSQTIGKRTIYANDKTKLSVYGYLYNWFVVSDSRGICPSGWHVPEREELSLLINFLGGEKTAGSKLKEKSSTLWQNSNLENSNESGFTGIPGGIRGIIQGGYSGIGSKGVWWSSTKYDKDDAYKMELTNNSNDAKVGVTSMLNGFSIRCVKDNLKNSNDSIPKISTIQITDVTSNSAQSGGSISSEGGSEIIAKGVVWSRSKRPDILTDSTTREGKGIGTFSSALSGLISGKKYYVRAYATSKYGTSYGQELSFKTLISSKLPKVETSIISDITQKSAFSGGKILNDGDLDIITKGVVWSKNINPKLGLFGNKTKDGIGNENFISIIDKLSPFETYYVRAYATNSAGTGYGNELTFKTTAAAVVAALSTAPLSSITSKTAVGGGNISSDGGSNVTARGVVWSTTAKPTISLTTKTSDGTGIGSFSASLTNLIPKTTYYVRAYATNNAGTAYGNEITFTTKSDSTNVMGIPCPGITTVKDIDGNTYNTVQIGTQCWTKENLRVTKYRDGSVIPLDESGGVNGNGTGQTWSSRTIGARTVYGHSASNLATYGYLYNWYSVADIKGLCPSGWHVPSDGEWNSLSSYLGNDPGIKLADTSWILAFGKPTNESGFSVKPGGYRDTTGRFSTPLISGNFWSTTKFTSNLFWGRELYSKGYWDTYSYYGVSGLSVRCLKDTLSIVSIPSLSTTKITSITTTSATSGGNITSEGGASITARGIVWSTTTNPTVVLSTKTSNGTGTGTFTSALTNLTPKTTYYVRAYATNIDGTGYGNEISFTTSDSINVMGIPCPGAPTVKDIDGNTYNTVQIGTQCWTKENLRVTKYKDGTVIPLDESGGTTGDGNGQTWGNRNTGARTVYEHSVSNLATYGYLYNWYSTVDSKGLCPSGWHVPSDSEWTTLTTYLGGESVAGGKMKTIGTSNWDSSSPGANNSSGFSALPGSTRSSGDGSFCCIGSYANFWSATEEDNNRAWQRFLTSIYSEAQRGKSTDKSIGASVRCLKDTLTIVSIPSLTTTAITSITITSATSGGNITSDGGASITARGIVWSTNTKPTISLTTKTSDGTGTGSFSSSLTNLTPKTTYYVRAYATNNAGTAYGNEITFTTKSDSTSIMGIPCPGIPMVKDIDGNTYNTVQIGTQCWTKENLRVTKYRDSTVIPLDESGGTEGNGTGNTWNYSKTGARTAYAHTTTNLATYGYLYNWYAVVYSKGICPFEWHVPSDDEWITITDYLGGESIAGGKMKSVGTAYWNSPNLGATNESGFSALPGGYRDSGGSFKDIRSIAFFWSTSDNYIHSGWGRDLYSNYNDVTREFGNNKSGGASVRCIKDTAVNNTISIPTLSTSTVTIIKSNSANTGGNITNDGGTSIISRGVIWSISPSPTIYLSTKTSDGEGIGSFTSSLTTLTSNTTYYVRAYATNGVGTGYGNEVSFKTTPTAVVPSIFTIAVTSITSKTAVSGGNIFSDGWSSVTARGVVWSTNPNPTVSLTTKTTNGIGIGTFTSDMTDLLTNTTYYLRAYATNGLGTGYGNEVSFKTTEFTGSTQGVPCNTFPTVTDIDGNTYNTVQIGTQCWTKENLKVTKYNDGTAVPIDSSGGPAGWETDETWGTGKRTSGARTVYRHSQGNLLNFGYLYNWYAAKGIVISGSTNYKNLCPIGWHVPSDSEWTTLINFLGGEKVASSKMKSTGYVFWRGPNSGESVSTNESGFSALPGGNRNIQGLFLDIRDRAYFWSATEYVNQYAWDRSLYHYNSIVLKNSGNREVGASVRCLKD